MLQKIVNNKFKITQLLFLVGLLVLIRAYENKLFYDPFLSYFKAENATIYPEVDPVKLFISLFLRYCLNSILSLVILYLIFKDSDIIKFSGFLFILFFVILIIGFYVVLNCYDESQKSNLFYIRRFIIQPVFILLFIPGFYFQKTSEKK